MGQGVTLLCQTEFQSLLSIAQPEFLNLQDFEVLTKTAGSVRKV